MPRPQYMSCVWDINRQNFQHFLGKNNTQWTQEFHLGHFHLEPGFILLQCGSFILYFTYCYIFLLSLCHFVPEDGILFTK